MTHPSMGQAKRSGSQSQKSMKTLLGSIQAGDSSLDQFKSRCKLKDYQCIVFFDPPGSLTEPDEPSLNTDEDGEVTSTCHGQAVWS